MSNKNSWTAIRCPIDLCDAHAVTIEALTAAINAAPTASQKMPYARDLIGEVDVLLACASHDAANRNCGLCRGFSMLRRQTANLIVKTGARATP